MATVLESGLFSVDVEAPKEELGPQVGAGPSPSAVGTEDVGVAVLEPVGEVLVALALVVNCRTTVPTPPGRVNAFLQQSSCVPWASW